eukprot:SAG31_NODE_3393_length_4326_cov_2.068607_2_plen_243_part_00
MCAILLLVVGLIMGTRLWYSMWDAEEDNDTAFERRMDAVVREIGDRGKLVTTEPKAVPPRVSRQVAAPAPASVSSPAPSSTKAPMPPQLSAMGHTVPRVTPDRQESSPTSAVITFPEIVSFMRQEREMIMSMLERQRQALEAKMETHRQEMEVEREANMQAKLREQCLYSQLIVALQTRLEMLHASQLVSLEVLNAAEDAIAEEAINSDDMDGSITEKLLALSAKMPSDRAFARQLERQKWL